MIVFLVAMVTDYILHVTYEQCLFFNSTCMFSLSHYYISHVFLDDNCYGNSINTSTS